MHYVKTDTAYIITLEKGEHVLQTLTAFAKQEGITTAELRGVGAVEFVSCGYYELATKQYHFTTYEALVEVVSMGGNITLKEGEPFCHIHAVFTNTKNEAFGGHVEEMRVGVVLEVILTPFSDTVERTYNQDIGLFVMNCGSTFLSE